MKECDVGVQLALRILLRCEVCKRPVDPDVVESDASVAALFGSAPYALCWCGQKVSAKMRKNPKYRQRWDTVFDHVRNSVSQEIFEEEEDGNEE